mmetsp:Transcript_24197/g.53860  ORF Transcript_24197/g.53860 Transcript_24197/m.53860 type:complete len:360 (-) Transcript_24197:844-1923(-)
MKSFLQLGHDLVGHWVLVTPARAYLHRDASGGKTLAHGVYYLVQALWLVHQSRAGALVAHQIDGAAAVQIHEVSAGLLLQDAAGEANCVRVAARQLHPEAPLGGVPLQQRPLAGLTLHDVVRHGHLPAGDVCPVVRQDAAEGQVAHCGQRGHVHLVAEVHQLLGAAGEGLEVSHLVLLRLLRGLGLSLGGQCGGAVCACACVCACVCAGVCACDCGLDDVGNSGLNNLSHSSHSLRSLRLSNDHLCTCTCTHTCTHTCAHTHTCTHTCTHIRTHTHTHIHACTHIYTHTCTYAHTHTHTHTHTRTYDCTCACTYVTYVCPPSVVLQRGEDGCLEVLSVALLLHGAHYAALHGQQLVCIR